MAEERIAPRGEIRADVRHGILTWWVAATMGGKKNADYEDYIPKWKPVAPPKPQTMEQMRQTAMKITAMMGGTFR